MMRVFCIVMALMAGLVSSLVVAGEASYILQVDNVYDGDTVKGHVEIWPGLVQKVSIRIKGIDTPELRTKNKCEKALGLKAKQALIDFMGDKQITISNVKLGKYAGRVLADVQVNGQDVAQYMIQHGYARIYLGGKRQPWSKRCN